LTSELTPAATPIGQRKITVSRRSRRAKKALSRRLAEQDAERRGPAYAVCFTSREGEKDDNAVQMHFEDLYLLMI